ncbi:unnamed protein product [Euphydryas editha]|uniref:Uncharacterized protein n=1 Tax=Euphydryas editha TaxID=104508 RepID=A0AAU9V4M4_EUPED|nr:unnamed protein product [Euphydryas editha]
MHSDINRCLFDVIDNKAEEKLLRSKDNLCGTKLIIDVGSLHAQTSTVAFNNGSHYADYHHGDNRDVKAIAATRGSSAFERVAAVRVPKNDYVKETSCRDVLNNDTGVPNERCMQEGHATELGNNGPVVIQAPERCAATPAAFREQLDS